MRSGGINWLAVAASAIAIYAVGFVIYGLLISPEANMAMSGMTKAEEATAMSRMMYSPLMPVLTAVFMAVLFKWGAVGDMTSGVKWGVVIALASAIPTILYGWVYAGTENNTMMIDVAHLWLGHVAAGAILGAWR